MTEFRAFGATTILRRLALLEPKKRKKRVRWVFVFAVLGVAAALLLDASVREWLLERSRPLYARARAALVKAPPPPAATAASTEPPSSAPAPSTERAVGFAVATAPATSASAPAVAAPDTSPPASASAAPSPPSPPPAQKSKRGKIRSRRN